MPKLSEAVDINSIRFQEQATDAETVTGYGNVFLKDDKEWYGVDDVDTVKRLSGLNVSVADVSNPPTDAELDSAFGTPATVGAGYAAIVDDNDADTALWLVTSNGTSWWYVAMTKAT